MDHTFHSDTLHEVLSRLETDQEQGLSLQEGEKRLAEHGENRLEEAKQAGMLRRVLGQLKDPMILVLLAAAALSFFAGGGQDWLDAAIILLIVLFNTVISVSQEDNARKALEALRKLSAPKARVIRAGLERRLESSQLVPGDIIHLEAGDLVPADARILEATARLKKDGFLTPILVGVETEVKAAAEKGGFDIEGVRIVDPATYAGMDAMVEKMVELRKGKMTPEDCRKNLMKGNYFGTMLVKMGVADCLLGGATYSTADTVRPALQLIKTKPENKIVSSCFIMVREGVGDNTVLAMGDCAINIDPTEDELVEIAVETAKCAKIFGIDPQVAFLSYSTKGSGKGDTVDKMRNACAKAKAAAPELAIDGEMQFDAAVSPTVGQLKFPGSPVAGYANTFIFPNINAGNIGYKIAQRLGGFDAYGPILLGLNAPINDLSRGCNAQEVYSMAIITAALA